MLELTETMIYFLIHILVFLSVSNKHVQSNW